MTLVITTYSIVKFVCYVRLWIFIANSCMFVDYTGLPGRLARGPMGYLVLKLKFIHSFIHSDSHHYRSAPVTQLNRTTTLSVCPLAYHQFTSNSIWLALSRCHLWISQNLRPGVDSYHQCRHQEKQNKYNNRAECEVKSRFCLQCSQNPVICNLQQRT